MALKDLNLDQKLVAAIENDPSEEVATDVTHQPSTDTHQENPPASKPASQPVSLPANQPTSPPEPAPTIEARIPFDPEPPHHRGDYYKKNTFELYEAEVNFLRQARFDLDPLGVTKNAIVQTALELLAKDYQVNKETSFLVRKFTGHHTSR